MPTETITITVTGANPQTKTVAVNVDSTSGTGSTSVTFTGTNSGQDTFTATGTIASSPLTSNNAFVAWQATNGTVSLASNVTVAGYVNPGENPTWHGVGAAFSTLTNRDTVVVNQVLTNGTAGTGVPISGLVTDNGDSGQYRHQPPLLDDVKSDGTALTALGTPLGWGLGAAGDGSFVTFFQGQLVVASPGVETLYFLVDDSWGFYVGGGASYVAGAYTTSPGGGAPSSPSTAIAAASGTSLTVGAWPLLGTRNTAAIQIQPTDYVYVNFPSAGIYPFLAWWVNAASAQTYFQMTYSAGASAIPPASGNGESGSVIRPVALQAAPPATTPSGSLQLSLAQSNIQIQGNQITVNVNVTGIHYPNKQYIPILEGTAGKLFIYNSTSGNFNFQTYNGQPVDPTTAATNVFTLTGNTQSLFSIAYNNASDGQFSLIYSGTPFPANIAATAQLTVTAEDIAWFYSANKTYDTFIPASLGGVGGTSFSIEVDYMTNPSGVSVSPSSLPADGTVHVITVTLSEPMSPQQVGTGGITSNTVTPSFSSDSGTQIQSGVVAQYNGSGFLTGYTVPISVPFSNSNGSFNLFSTLTGTLSYLSGTSFISNGSVTYMSSVRTAVGLSGTGFQPPVPYSFSVSPNDTNLVNGPYTLTGQVYTLDNSPLTMEFYFNNSASGVTDIGPGTFQGSQQGSLNGQTIYISTFTISFTPPNQPNGQTDLLGFIATDTASNLQAQYYSSTTYTFPITITYGINIVQYAVFDISPGQYGCVGNTLLFDMPQNITAGNIMVMGVNEFDWSNVSGCGEIDFYDSLGNTFTRLTPISYNSYEQGTWIAVANIGTGGFSQIGTYGFGCHHANANNAAISIVCAEVSGMTYGATSDGATGFNLACQKASQGESQNTGTVFTNNPHDVIWTCAPGNDPPSGYTLIAFTESCNGFCWSASLAYDVVSGTGGYSPIWQTAQGSGVTLALTLAPQQ